MMESDYAARGNRLGEALAARVAERDAALARAEAAEVRAAEAERELEARKAGYIGPWPPRETTLEEKLAAVDRLVALGEEMRAGAPAAPPEPPPDEIVASFWDSLGSQAQFYNPPVKVYEDPIWKMTTKRMERGGAFMFDDPFWAAFHAAGLHVCHVQWLSAEQTEGCCDDRVFEIRFMFPAAPPTDNPEATP